MLRSIATVSVSGTLVEKLKAISRAGFDGVEIFENDLLYFDGSPADVKRICADLGLQIMLFQPFRDFEGVSAERLARNLERARRKFELMHELFQVLNAARRRRGSIDFDLNEAEVVIDEGGMVEAIIALQRNIAHRLIEEFMLLANQTVASQWTEYQDMTTASSPITISGHVVPVGIKPVVLH